MEVIDLIKDFIVLAGVPTAIGVLWKSTTKIVHIVDRFEDLERHSRENYLNILRLVVMSPHMPLGERIIAGQKYIDEGGNGEVRQYIREELHVDERMDLNA